MAGSMLGGGTVTRIVSKRGSSVVLSILRSGVAVPVRALV